MGKKWEIAIWTLLFGIGVVAIALIFCVFFELKIALNQENTLIDEIERFERFDNALEERKITQGYAGKYTGNGPIWPSPKTGGSCRIFTSETE